MKIISFNVNGIRAILGKSFKEDFLNLDADIFALQETKFTETSHDNFPFNPDNYHLYWTNSKLRKGYSGVCVYSRLTPLNVHYGLEEGKYDEEGRVITLEFDDFYFVCCYVPNSGEELKRLDFRMVFEEELKKYLVDLDKKKPVVYCGDLNVAHEEIDLKNPKSNTHNAGFTKEEREKFSLLLEAGFTDTFRKLHGSEVKYSWWSYRFNARANNAGWRIDYFLVSDRLMEKVINSEIHNEIYGSDHCPVELNLAI